jgi:glycerol-3-phosphate acyltransferase PlsY
MSVLPEITSSMTQLGVWAVVGYLLGSIPFGILIARVMGLGNLRSIGSGNIGATNVLRTGNKKAAFLTLVFDGGKGAVAVLIAQRFANADAVQIATFAAFLGHCFPVWLGFKGGKGVATFLGVLLALVWPIGIACCATWLAVAVVLRISSLSALVAAASSIVWAFVFGVPQFVILFAALVVLIFYRHSANIVRLIAGTEPKIGQK